MDWEKKTNYLSMPGTSEPLAYRDNSLVAENGEGTFPVHGSIADFLQNDEEEQKKGTDQLEYWESETPNLRSCEHPVQVQFAEQRFAYLDEIIDFEGLDSALDIGCGNGAGTLSLKKRVANVFGLDMSNYLLSQLPEGVVGLRGDATRLPLKDKSVDISMAWELIHHIKDPVPVLAEMKRVTRKWIVIFEPNRWNPLQAGFGLAVSHERMTLRNTRGFLQNLAQQAGLKTVQYDTVGCIFPNKSPLWLAKILKLIPFKLPLIGISHVFILKVE